MITTQREHNSLSNSQDNSINSRSNSDVSELIRLVKEQDVEAFEQLYRLHSGRVYALCLRLTANTAKAEEFAQEAFVRAWLKIHSFRGDSSFASWLYRLTTNVVLSELRKKSLQLVSLEDITVEASGSVSQFGAEQIDTGKIMDMEKAINQLPSGARTIFVLHDIEGYKHTEIAEMTQLAVGTSKTQLHRARKLLKGWL